jgi:hypothetical protein
MVCPRALKQHVRFRGQGYPCPRFFGRPGTTCATFNQNFLNNFWPVHALLWERGKAIDLGNLGGQTGQAGGNIAYGINNQRPRGG